MIPLKDDAPRYSTPYVNYFLLALNVVIFLVIQLGSPASQKVIVDTFAFKPILLTSFVVQHNPTAGIAGIVTVFTSMFMHSGWWHLIGNMWVLYIFGDNIEDYLGHFSYLLFYLLAGVAAILLHALLNPTSAVPTVGASGAIAGVMGAYFILYPQARVLTLVPFLFVFFLWLPAWIVLGYWILTQFLGGAASSISTSGQTGGGIAFWAHVGGFGAGMLMVKIFPGTRRRRFRYNAW